MRFHYGDKVINVKELYDDDSSTDRSFDDTCPSCDYFHLFPNCAKAYSSRDEYDHITYRCKQKFTIWAWAEICHREDEGRSGCCEYIDVTDIIENNPVMQKDISYEHVVGIVDTIKEEKPDLLKPGRIVQT